MSSQVLIDIIQDEKSLAVLNNLIEKAREIDVAVALLGIDKKTLMDDVKLLGLKPMEFNKIVKYKINEELLMNELNFLELVNDNLMD